MPSTGLKGSLGNLISRWQAPYGEVLANYSRLGVGGPIASSITTGEVV